MARSNLSPTRRATSFLVIKCIFKPTVKQCQEQMELSFISVLVSERTQIHISLTFFTHISISWLLFVSPAVCVVVLVFSITCHFVLLWARELSYPDLFMIWHRWPVVFAHVAVAIRSRRWNWRETLVINNINCLVKYVTKTTKINTTLMLLWVNVLGVYLQYSHKIIYNSKADIPIYRIIVNSLFLY